MLDSKTEAVECCQLQNIVSAILLIFLVSESVSQFLTSCCNNTKQGKDFDQLGNVEEKNCKLKYAASMLKFQPQAHGDRTFLAVH